MSARNILSSLGIDVSKWRPSQFEFCKHHVPEILCFADRAPHIKSRKLRLHATPLADGCGTPSVRDTRARPQRRQHTPSDITPHATFFPIPRWRQKKRRTASKTLGTRSASKGKLRRKPPPSKSAAKHRSLRVPRAQDRETPTLSTKTPPCRCSTSPWISSRGASGRGRWGARARDPPG